MANSYLLWSVYEFSFSSFSLVNTFASEQLTPQYIKLNPQHTVPTLDDNGQVLGDSHAIVTYLVQKYGGTKYASLCPTEPFARALVDHRLHLDNGTLFNRFGKLVGPVFRGKATELDPEGIKSIQESLDFLEVFLSKDNYVAGSNLTVADFSCVTTVTIILLIVPYEESRYPKLLAWIDRLSKLPYYHDIVTKNLDEDKQFFAEKFNSLIKS